MLGCRCHGQLGLLHTVVKRCMVRLDRRIMPFRWLSAADNGCFSPVWRPSQLTPRLGEPGSGAHTVRIFLYVPQYLYLPRPRRLPFWPPPNAIGSSFQSEPSERKLTSVCWLLCALCQVCCLSLHFPGCLPMPSPTAHMSSTHCPVPSLIALSKRRPLSLPLSPRHTFESWALRSGSILHHR